MYNKVGIRVSSPAKAAGFILTAALLLLASCQNGAPPPPAESKIAFSGESTVLAMTHLVPAFESPLAGEGSTIWCDTFQIAWNGLMNDVFGGPILVADQEYLCNLLNGSRVSADDIFPESFYVKAGFSTQEFLDQLKAEMAEKFPGVEVPEFEPDEKVLSFSYLFVEIEFPTPYEIIRDGMEFITPVGVPTKVKAFGIDPKTTGNYEMQQQVEVLFHNKLENGDYEFAVDLWKESSPYQLVLARIAPGESLAATYDRAIELESQYSEDPEFRDFHSSDDLMVPEIWWEIEHRYSELEQKPFLNAGFENQMIDAAYQKIDFKLNNKGFVLESKAHIDGAEIAPAPGRRFVFDRPFLLYVKKREAATPLFAMWIDNAELMVKPEESSPES